MRVAKIVIAITLLAIALTGSAVCALGIIDPVGAKLREDAALMLLVFVPLGIAGLHLLEPN